MKVLVYLIVGILGAAGITFLVYDCIDMEVARKDYIENVEKCEPINGCLFSWNCERYNKLIRKVCND